jgi:hydrogenase maturation factor
MSIKRELEIAEGILKKYLQENDPTEFGCACSPTSICGPCMERNRQAPLHTVLKLLQS